MKKQIFLLIIFLVISTNCNADAVQVDIEANYNSKTTSWQVTYNFNTLVSEVSFSNQNVLYNIIGENNAQWVSYSNVQKLKKAFRKLKFEVTPETTSFQKSYEPMILFSDNSSLLYTPGLIPQQITLPNNSTKSLHQGEINVSLKLYENSKFIKETAINKGYESIGTQPSQDMGFAQFVFDKNIEDSNQQSIIDALSNVNLYLSSKLNIKLTAKPQIYISRTKDNSSAVSGNALRNQIQVSIPASNDFDQKDFQEVLGVLSHEFVHLYTKGYDEKSSIWFTEGIAEYISKVGLYELSYITFEEYLNSFEIALNSCIESIFENSFTKVDNNTAAIYSCGFAIMSSISYLTNSEHAKLESKLWSQLIDINNFNESNYLSLLKVELNEVHINMLKQLMMKQDSSTESVLSLFKELPHTQLSNHNFSESTYGINILLKVLKQECEGYSFFVSENKVVLNDEFDCASFKDVREIYELNNFNIINEGSLAYDSVHEKCNDKKKISIHTNLSEPINIKCNSSVIKRPNYIKLKELL